MMNFIENYLTEIVMIVLLSVLVGVFLFAVLADNNKSNAQLDKCITLLKETDVKNPETLCAVILDK